MSARAKLFPVELSLDDDSHEVSSQQSGCSMILKHLGVTDIATQCIHALVAAYVHHFENRTAGSSRREKT
jgi:hypothetical protein